MDTENTSSSSPLPPVDEKVTQKSSDHPHKDETHQATHKWTGFQGKTVWDWLQLLAVIAIPLILGIATLLFGIQQAHLADLQHQSDQKLAQLQHEADQQSILDQQRQATLVTYLDDMRDLLLNRGLLTSKPNDEVRVIARTETLSAMRQLDGKRNGFLVQFLQDAHLIGSHSGNIVSFAGADLNSIDLSGTNLSGTNLSSADLSGANLSGANLSSATLTKADLSSAILSSATLLGATLIDAALSSATLTYTTLADAIFTDANFTAATLTDVTLTGANFTAANFTTATLTGSDLTAANFTAADLYSTNLTNDQITQQQLDQVENCLDAILPTGLAYHQNFEQVNPPG